MVAAIKRDQGKLDDGHPGDKTASNDGSWNGTFELVAQGYYWSLQGGCLCPAGSPYPSRELEACSHKEQRGRQGCLQLSHTDDTYIDMPIVRGKKYCAFRDTSYTFAEMEHPGADGKCNATSKMSKRCGNTGHAFCIPAYAKCPLTKVVSTNGQLVGSSDPVHGRPVLDVKYSQDGAPCVSPGERGAKAQKSF